MACRPAQTAGTRVTPSRRDRFEWR
jgi:hypothetical protein